MIFPWSSVQSIQKRRITNRQNDMDENETENERIPHDEAVWFCRNERKEVIKRLNGVADVWRWIIMCGVCVEGKVTDGQMSRRREVARGGILMTSHKWGWLTWVDVHTLMRWCGFVGGIINANEDVHAWSNIWRIGSHTPLHYAGHLEGGGGRMDTHFARRRGIFSFSDVRLLRIIVLYVTGACSPALKSGERIGIPILMISREREREKTCTRRNLAFVTGRDSTTGPPLFKGWIEGVAYDAWWYIKQLGGSSSNNWPVMIDQTQSGNPRGKNGEWTNRKIVWWDLLKKLQWFSGIFVLVLIRNFLFKL